MVNYFGYITLLTDCMCRALQQVDLVDVNNAHKNGKGAVETYDVIQNGRKPPSYIFTLMQIQSNFPAITPW